MIVTEALLRFRETQNITALGLSTVDKRTEEINVIAIEILSWLKLEYKRESLGTAGKSIGLKPLRLNMKNPWCCYLKELLESENALSEVFSIEGDNLTFKECISEAYRAEARRLAHEGYNPEKIC